MQCLEREPDKRALKKLAFVTKSKSVKHWDDTLRELTRWEKRAKTLLNVYRELV